MKQWQELVGMQSPVNLAPQCQRGFPRQPGGNGGIRHLERCAPVARPFAGSAGGPAALNALGHQPGLSNDALSRLLVPTHTGTVRLIDRLVADGLVERRPAVHEKRGVALYLTAAGRSVRRDILAGREAALLPLVSRLSAREQKTLASLLGKLLTEVSRDDTHKLRICRLCDSGACEDCPILVPVAPQGPGATPA